MQTRNPLFADLARVISGAVGLAAGLRREVEAQLRQQLERTLARFDLVEREEFEAVRAMAVAARESEEVLAGRLAALEAEVAALKGGAGAGPARAPGKGAGRKRPGQKGTGTKAGRAKGQGDSGGL